MPILQQDPLAIFLQPSSHEIPLSNNNRYINASIVSLPTVPAIPLTFNARLASTNRASTIDRANEEPEQHQCEAHLF